MNLEDFRMYMIAVRGGLTDETSRDLQRFVRQRGGFILMVTRTGPIVALEEGQAGALADHPLVEFVGPVQLNPRGFAAEQLERIFAENLSKQVVIVEHAGGGDSALRS
jgi:hypothetical protein